MAPQKFNRVEWDKWPLINFYSRDFAGRQDILSGTESWIKGGSGGVRVYSAPPGFGKSALMARIIAAHEHGQFAPDAHIIGVFAGKYQTMSPGEVWAQIVQQWIDLLGRSEEVPEVAPVSLREQIHALLDQIGDTATPEAPWVMVLDGLESVISPHKWFMDFLPRAMPENVYWLLTRRSDSQRQHLSGMLDFKAEHLTLPPFSEAETAQFIQKVIREDDIADKIVKRFYKVSGGDPLYLRFWVKSLQSRFGQLRESESIEVLLPDIEVNTYWQRILGGLPTRAALPDQALSILYTLTAARGPLSINELSQILEAPPNLIRAALPSLSPFLMQAEGYDLMHERIRDAMLNVLGDKVRPYKEKLLTFCASWREHTEQSAYVLRHYAYHLGDQNRSADLHALLQDPEWKRAHENHSGDARSFFYNVEIALHQAMESGPERLEEQIRYVMLYSGISQHAPQPPEAHTIRRALERLLDTTPLPTENMQDLVHLAADSGCEQAIPALIAQISGQMLQTLLKDLLRIAYALEDGEAQAEALTILADHIPQELRHEVLKDALEAAESAQSAYGKALALSALVPYLAEAEQSQETLSPHRRLLAAVDTLQDQEMRCRAWMAILDYLPVWEQAETLERILNDIRSIGAEESRTRILVALAAHMQNLGDFHEKPRLTDMTFNLAAELRDPEMRMTVFTALLDKLAIAAERREQIIMKGIGALEEINAAGAKAETIKMFANLANLPDGAFPILRDEALQVEEVAARAEALIALTTMNGTHPAVTGQALEAIKRIEDDDDEARALSDLLPYLPNEALGDVLATIYSLEDKAARVHALTAVLIHFPLQVDERVTMDTVAAAMGIERQFERAVALSRLSELLPANLRPSVLSRSLDAARSLSNQSARSRALAEIIPSLNQDLLPNAIADAHTLTHPADRVRVLMALIPLLSEEARLKLQKSALETVRFIPADYEKASVLTVLAPIMPPALIEDVYAQIMMIHNVYDRAMALAQVIPHLPPRLQASAKEEALEAARRCEVEYEQVSALVSMMPHMPMGERIRLLDEALEATVEIEDAYDRSSAIIVIAPRINNIEKGTETRPTWMQQMSDALQAALQVQNPQRRGRVLRALAARWQEFSDPAQIYAFWREALPHISGRSFHQIADDLAELAPALYRMGGDQALTICARALLEGGYPAQ